MTEWNGAVENHAEDQASLVLKSVMHLWSRVWSSFKVNSVWLWWLSFWMCLLRCGLFLQPVLELWHLPWRIAEQHQCKCQVHYWAKWTDLVVDRVAEWSREWDAGRQKWHSNYKVSLPKQCQWLRAELRNVIYICVSHTECRGLKILDKILPASMCTGWELDRGKAAGT